MWFDYFYGQQAEQFSFYRIPKILFTDERFRGISVEAKTLYGILLDRMNLSAKTDGWMGRAGSISFMTFYSRAAITTTQNRRKSWNC